MAKFGTYYGLCPLIDQKNLLGISQADVKNCVVVTLGRNIAIKYKLSDQKQIQSWSTKTKFSSYVIYDDEEKKYVAAFNQAFIRKWGSEDVHLDTLKKIKFQLPLHGILKCEDISLVIFKNGTLSTLSKAVEVSKLAREDNILEENEIIEHESCVKVGNNFYVGLLVKSGNDLSYVWICFDAYVRNEVLSVRKIAIKREGIMKFIGHVLHITTDDVLLLTLWSDCKLFSLSLTSSDTTKPITDTLLSLVESVSCKEQVCMVSLNEDYIAMYGAEKDLEGACLVMFNVQFKTAQCRHQFKIFTVGSKLWCIGNYLLLTVGQNLAVVPFYLAAEQLAALIGSHRMPCLTDDVDLTIVSRMEVAQWSEQAGPDKVAVEVPDQIKGQVEELALEGRSEAEISEIIVSASCEARDVKKLKCCLSFFQDIPEKTVFRALQLALALLREDNELMQTVLSLPFDTSSILPFLKSGLTFAETLDILGFLVELFVADTALPSLKKTESDRQLMDWGCLLIDSHYQSFLLSKDERSSQVVKDFKKFVDEFYLLLADLESLRSLVERVRSKQYGKARKQLCNYYVESVSLYVEAE